MRVLFNQVYVIEYDKCLLLNVVMKPFNSLDNTGIPKYLNLSVEINHLIFKEKFQRSRPKQTQLFNDVIDAVEHLRIQTHKL